MISMRPAVQIASSIHKAHPRQPRLFSVTWVTAWTMTWLPPQRGHFIYLSPSRTLVYRHNHIRFYMNMQGNIAARQDSAIDRTGKMIINKRFALSLRIPTGETTAVRRAQACAQKIAPDPEKNLAFPTVVGYNIEEQILGILAQLVERYVHIVEVTGSSPVNPTTKTA